MFHKGPLRELSLLARFILLALAALTAACTTLSEPEQPSVQTVLTETEETKPDHEAEYEKAKQECADVGGEWVTFLSGHGVNHYAYSMRCWSSRPPVNDPRWKEPGLLPYDATVEHARGTGEMVGLHRLRPEYFQRLMVDERDDTGEKK